MWLSGARRLALSVGVALALIAPAPLSTAAQDREGDPGDAHQPGDQRREDDPVPGDTGAGGASTFRARARAEPDDLRGRSTSTIDRDDLDALVVRSAPDALRVVPGVTVQQTAHGQASPYVRGLTGQQVLLVFDGIRLNNGIFRQGPNQYFFTVDPASVDRIHVIRGSASTRWGSDALGGAILTVPREPTIDPAIDGVVLRPRAIGRFGSQDLDLGGRAELDAQLGRELGFLGGAGYRAAGPLQGGGIVCDLAGPEPCVPAADPAMRVSVPMVPFVESDGRTQRGTGFSALTWDGRLVWRPSARVRVTAAGYGFHQYDTPRTDQCPAPFAPGNDCLRHVEQSRTLASLAIALRPERAPEIDEVRVILSWARLYEHRRRDRPTAFVQNDFHDEIDTYGLVVRARSRALAPGGPLALALHFGADGYLDRVRSDASIRFTDVGIVVPQSRGQYVDHSVFGQLGAWLELEASVEAWLAVRGGVRAQYASARAAADPSSGTRRVDRDVGGLVGRVGAELRVAPELSILANVDQGFRAPNLDDLTSRQQAGPGFQIENADLREERSVTYEVGARARPHAWIALEAWAFAIQLDGAITRVPREASECPPLTPQCNASWSRYQLVNAVAESWVLGGELAATLDVTEIGLVLRATGAAAWGEGPSPTGEGRVPLSRVPPVNGILDAAWRHDETGISVGAMLRWALDQTRLAPSDLGDARIPLGGTPGYATLDVRAGWELAQWVRASVVFENVFDQPYRVHGSSINGPGRGVLVRLDVGL